MENFKESIPEDVKKLTQLCFEKFKINDVVTLCNNKDYKFYKKNQIIIKENTPLTRLFYLKQGKVKIFKTDKNKKEQIIRFANNQELLGVETVISGETHLYSATALEDLYLCTIPVETFFQLMLEKPEIYYCLIRSLSNILKEINNRNISIIQKTEIERLAEALIILYTKYKSDKIQLLKKDLATYTNIGKNQLRFYLEHLREEKTISFNSERIKITDADKLECIANGNKT